MSHSDQLLGSGDNEFIATDDIMCAAIEIEQEYADHNREEFERVTELDPDDPYSTEFAQYELSGPVPRGSTGLGTFLDDRDYWSYNKAKVQETLLTQAEIYPFRLFVDLLNLLSEQKAVNMIVDSCRSKGWWYRFKVKTILFCIGLLNNYTPISTSVGQYKEKENKCANV
jgi:hypothetical protein